jgi:hypothetical protein
MRGPKGSGSPQIRPTPRLVLAEGVPASTPLFAAVLFDPIPLAAVLVDMTITAQYSSGQLD